MSLLLVVACAPSSAEVSPESALETSAKSLGIEGCAGAPAGLDLTTAAIVKDPNVGSGTFVAVAPGQVRPGQPVTLVVGERLGPPVTAVARLTSNGWVQQTDVPLADWCEVPNGLRYHGVSLGSWAAGSVLEVAVHLDAQDGSQNQFWLNNGGRNFRIEVRAPAVLGWVGDTHLRINEQTIPADLVPAGQSLEVYTQTWPMGAAERVTLHWATANSSQLGSATFRFDQDHAGPNANNTQWKTLIPAEQVIAGQPLTYWVSATDSQGKTLWDSRDGANYTLTPRAFPTPTVTAYGSWRPTDRSFTAGGLFVQGGATATGCENHGASLSSYVERAVRVHVAGLTDRAYPDDAARRAASQILRADVQLDANVPQANSSLQFQTQQGGDFIYSFFSFNRFCSSGVEVSSVLGDGRYAWRLRFSLDGGRSFSQTQDWGLQFGRWCSYFGDPFGCHPPSNTYYSFDYVPASVVRIEAARARATTVTATLTNKLQNDLSFNQLSLVGPHAALFTYRVTDGMGRAIDPVRPFTLSPGQSLRFDFTLNATEASGPLPFSAELKWLTVPPGGSLLVETLFYLRGVVP